MGGGQRAPSGVRLPAGPMGDAGMDGSSPYANSSVGGMSESPSAYFTPGGSVVTLPVQTESSLGFSAGSTPQKTGAGAAGGGGVAGGSSMRPPEGSPR